MPQLILKLVPCLQLLEFHVIDFLRIQARPAEL